MEYNTSLPRLVISEYGRNIQKMIDYAITVEDRTERNKVAQSIINVMGQLNPHLRDVHDFKHKLWDHIFIISEFKLDVDSPYPMPTAETFQTKPERVSYPGKPIRYKHYGRTTERMINKATEFAEGEEKEALTEILANLMKRSYLNWNRDTVQDSVILKQLEELSEGKLKLKNDTQLKSVQTFVSRNNPNPNPRNDKHKRQGDGQRPNNKFRKKF